MQRNEVKIEIMKEQEKRKWKANPKHMVAFFPTYTTLINNQLPYCLMTNRSSMRGTRNNLTA